jgi:hypothetical protein
MTKEFVKRILESNNITDKDLNEFIDDYTYTKLNRRISGEELAGILQLIRMGVFNLRFALLEAATMLELNVITAFDKNGVIVKTHVYESF